MGGGVDRHAFELPQRLAPQGVDLPDGLHRVAPKLHPDGPVLFVGREDLHPVAPHPEGAPMKIDVVALVQNLHQLAQHLPAVLHHALLQVEEHAVVGLGGAQTVDAGHRGHDDHVLAVEQRAGGGVAHPVNGFVDGGVFLDIEIGLGDVGLRLIVIVVADEILHRVVREELLELAVELGRQRLVGGQDQGGQVELGHDVGDGKGLAGPGDPQEHLVGIPGPHPRQQLPDGLGLVAGGRERGD